MNRQIAGKRHSRRKSIRRGSKRRSKVSKRRASKRRSVCNRRSKEKKKCSWVKKRSKCRRRCKSYCKKMSGGKPTDNKKQIPDLLIQQVEDIKREQQIKKAYLECLITRRSIVRTNLEKDKAELQKVHKEYKDMIFKSKQDIKKLKEKRIKSIIDNYPGLHYALLNSLTYKEFLTKPFTNKLDNNIEKKLALVHQKIKNPRMNLVIEIRRRLLGLKNNDVGMTNPENQNENDESKGKEMETMGEVIAKSADEAKDTVKTVVEELREISYQQHMNKLLLGKEPYEDFKNAKEEADANRSEETEQQNEYKIFREFAQKKKTSGEPLDVNNYSYTSLASWQDTHDMKSEHAGLLIMREEKRELDKSLKFNETELNTWLTNRIEIMDNDTDVLREDIKYDNDLINPRWTDTSIETRKKILLGLTEEDKIIDWIDKSRAKGSSEPRIKRIMINGNWGKNKVQDAIENTTKVCNFNYNKNNYIYYISSFSTYPRWVFGPYKRVFGNKIIFSHEKGVEQGVKWGSLYYKTDEEGGDESCDIVITFRGKSPEFWFVTDNTATEFHKGIKGTITYLEE